MQALLLLLNMITPFVMALVGFILKKHPVSNMNSQNGYNTPVSRKSQAHWDYAQKIAPGIYISLAKYLSIAEVIASVILLLLRVPIEYSVTIGECIGFVFMSYSFYYVDGKIKERFTDKLQSQFMVAGEPDNE